MKTKNSKVYDIIMERSKNLNDNQRKYVYKFITNFGQLVRQMPDIEYFRKVMRADYIKRINALDPVYDDLKTYLINYVVTRIIIHRNGFKTSNNGCR